MGIPQETRCAFGHREDIEETSEEAEKGVGGPVLMQEVLSRSRDSSEVPNGAEFVVLRLSDIGPDDVFPSFWVTERVARWDATEKRIIWDAPQFHSFAALDEARNRYEERRRVLVEQGFANSDMDW